MTTAFQIGETVKSKTSTQGLKLGEEYRIEAIDRQPTAFGTLVSYRLVSLRDGCKLHIGNGHMILEAA